MAHKRSINDTFIGVNLNNNKYTLYLINAREVMGHDDSLPYNAFFEVRNDETKETISGKVWNDGWGGSSIVELDDQKWHKDYNEFTDYVEKHLYFTFNGYAYNLDISLLFDNLALLSIDHPKNNGHIFTEQALINFLKG